MRIYTLLSALPFVCVSVACAVRAPERRTDLLRTQLDDDWKYWMTEYPEVATSFGYPGQNARWTDYSQSAIDARAKYLKESASRLSAIDRASLDANDQLNYDLYRDLLDTAAAGLGFHNDALPIRGVIPHNLLMPINQLEGIAQDIPRTITLMPTVTREDYENIVSRLQGVGPLVDQTIALMEQGLSAGLTPPKITMRDVPAQVAAQVIDDRADPLKSPMLEPFTKWPVSIAGKDRADLTARATAAYRRGIAPAFMKLREFLVSRYIPACRDAIAASELPNGAAMYAYNVKWHVTTNDTPQQIHDIGLAEVKRIRAEMDAIVASTGFKGSNDDFKQYLRTNPKFFFRDAPSLLTAYRDIAKRAEPELAHLFGRLPQTPYGVEPVPDAVAPSQTTAYYEPGSFAAGRPANMFANTYKLDSRPSWEMTALTLHESVPGHHIQIALAQEMQSLPEFRKNSSYTAFVEGWALYSESLGDEMGLYKDRYAKFGQLTYEAWRAVRLVVDTGLHSMGWTRDQAIDYFRANTAKTDQDIVVEVDRYIVWPGQALGYKMGQLKIRGLRTNAERQLGQRFDVRGFHDVVLGLGAVPLDVLERQVDAWVAKVGAERH
ncbi:MAG: DUF885 domain-containing protein [Vicinamibacterales bacterium]|nr:DUF885 domain-containing protein [Vicinamibacterales bacterium]